MADRPLFNVNAPPFVPRQIKREDQEIEDLIEENESMKPQPPPSPPPQPQPPQPALTSAETLDLLDPADGDVTISITVRITQVNAVRKTTNGIEICTALGSCADGRNMQITGWRNLATRVSRELMNNHIMTIDFLRCSSIAKGLNNGQFVHEVCLSAATTITDHGAQVEVEQVPLINLDLVGVTMGKFKTRGFVLNVPRALGLRHIGSIVESNIKVNLCFNGSPPVMSPRQEVHVQGRFVNQMIQVEHIELGHEFLSENDGRLQNVRAPNRRRSLD
ncbi:hypothetical protein M3Y98_01202500 [Aphelenchoides besseyi]|nr:hypothetical protein M3Y98_01202500 [Aphelenchoides besseyi]